MQPLPFAEPVALKRAVNWLGPEHPFGIVDITRLAQTIWQVQSLSAMDCISLKLISKLVCLLVNDTVR